MITYLRTVFEKIRKEFAGIFQAALATIAGFGEGTPQQDSHPGKRSRRIFKKSLRLMARRYSVFVPIVKGERQHFRLLLPLITRQCRHVRLSTAGVARSS